MPPRKINLIEAADAKIAKVAKFGEVFDWHAHDDEDEAFLVLRGKIAIDFRDGPVELGEGDFIVVPRGVEHRPRSLTVEPVVLMFEPATTLNTGNAQSDLTVTDLKRL
ncbi:cupin domain-containing protein [Mesorhizobium sp. WSM4887]|uniref:cupin domain-containing protein n=1 Tax=Mesorhizobium sp. WSM4887 TaxID=3038543 RepID=UPI0024165876|nr:cupin domain-containing protein [Mesorhizobium sp. WSM4887]MDG4890505.1 cupin domain-containing protein [Mesorhizobium sp. WSM4887]